METKDDFRHCMGCQGCWAREYNVLGESTCKVDMFDKNRPASIPPHKMRHQLSGALDRQELMTWRCEYRYSAVEIEYMRSGQWRKAGVPKAIGEKMMEKINVF